jgi:hypothetical protein
MPLYLDVANDLRNTTPTLVSRQKRVTQRQNEPAIELHPGQGDKICIYRRSFQHAIGWFFARNPLISRRHNAYSPAVQWS